MSEEKLYSFSKTPKVSKNESDNTRSFKTMQKNRSEEIPPSILATATSQMSLGKKKFVIPTTLADLRSRQYTLMRLGEEEADSRAQSGEGMTAIYKIVTRIYAIESEMSRYIVICSDDTFPVNEISMYCPKHHNETLNSFLRSDRNPKDFDLSAIQFEPSQQYGHPYYKFWLKFVMERKDEDIYPKWLIQKVEPIRDANELTYHWSLTMAHKLGSKS